MKNYSMNGKRKEKCVAYKELSVLLSQQKFETNFRIEHAKDYLL